MTKTLTALLAVGALGLAACGGVDRAGTRDEYIKGVEAAGATADSDCIDAVLDQYSDDELKTLDDAVESGDTSAAEGIANELLDCVDLGG